MNITINTQVMIHKANNTLFLVAKTDKKETKAERI